MILCITNQCNRDCDYCFEGAFKKGPVRMMSVEDVRKICDFAQFSRRPGAAVNVMGGEPTCHPQFVEIMHLLRQLNATANIAVLTNLLCDPAVWGELAGAGLRFLANVGGLPGYTPEERDRLHANFEFLRAHRPFLSFGLAVTIVEPDQDFGFLYRMLEEDTPDPLIGGIRVGIACPGMGFANRFPHEFSLQYGAKYLEIVTECHRIRPLVAFRNECPVNLCMMSEDVVDRLAPAVEHLCEWCGGNFDILPGGSTHWCFAFEGVPEMCIDDIFTYRSMDEVGAVLRIKAYELERVLDSHCRAEDCELLRCTGPCLATKYYRARIRGRR